MDPSIFSMQKNANEAWRLLERCNLVLASAAFLDPLSKMRYLEFSFPNIYPRSQNLFMDGQISNTVSSLHIMKKLI